MLVPNFSGPPDPNLKDLVLLRVSDWYTVGLQLGVREADLDDIESNYSDIRERRRGMFKTWLRTTPNPSYAQLARALFLAEENNIARSICQKYGKYCGLLFK